MIGELIYYLVVVFLALSLIVCLFMGDDFSFGVVILVVIILMAIVGVIAYIILRPPRNKHDKQSKQ